MREGNEWIGIGIKRGESLEVVDEGGKRAKLGAQRKCNRQEAEERPTREDDDDDGQRRWTIEPTNNGWRMMVRMRGLI